MSRGGRALALAVVGGLGLVAARQRAAREPAVLRWSSEANDSADLAATQTAVTSISLRTIDPEDL